MMPRRRGSGSIWRLGPQPEGAEDASEAAKGREESRLLQAAGMTAAQIAEGRQTGRESGRRTRWRASRSDCSLSRIMETRRSALFRLVMGRRVRNDRAAGGDCRCGHALERAAGADSDPLRHRRETQMPGAGRTCCWC